MGGRPFTGAWIETLSRIKRLSFSQRRPFTGAWIETRLPSMEIPHPSVAPSRGRGLKLDRRRAGGLPALSPLHGGVD